MRTSPGRRATSAVVPAAALLVLLPVAAVVVGVLTAGAAPWRRVAGSGWLPLTGTTLEGKPWSLADRAGTVVVVNVWGSWCPPCIEETPALQKAWEKVQADGKRVDFIGLDKLESPETGLAFQKANDVTYPSLAYDGGVPILSLQGKASATPTTLVLDAQGRIAARVSGPVTTTTLLGLVDDVIDEKA